MTTLKNSLNSERAHAHSETQSPVPDDPPHSVKHFISTYDARASFFADSFVKKVKEGNRKALAELQQFALPPTRMDIRKEFTACLESNIHDAYCFCMKDGKIYTMEELKRLVPQWAEMAERALIDSDPALADKLMTQVQWNARSAFEVAFVNAMNELTELKKKKQAPAGIDHYTKWFLNPLAQALVQLKQLNPPGNSLVGYGKRISLREAVSIAENLPREFQKLAAK